MTHRLESLGCVARSTWEGLVAQGFDTSRVRAHLGLRSQRPQNQRLPERYTLLAVQAFEEAKITETELMRLLRCSRVEAREEVDRLTQQMEVGAGGETYHLDLQFGDTLRLESMEKAG